MAAQLNAEIDAMDWGPGAIAGSCWAAAPIQRTHVTVLMSIIPTMLIYHFLIMDIVHTSVLREALYKLSVHSYVRWDGGT